MRKVSDNANGNVYYDAQSNVSVFEDTQQETPRYYAWVGDWDAHDHAHHIDGDSLLHAAELADGWNYRAFMYAHEAQGFTGTFDQWRDLPDNERNAYERGAAGIGTV
jgi:hypothetical protein